MPPMRSSIVQIVNIYVENHHYHVVPAVRQAAGTWLEVSPVRSGPLTSVADLEAALSISKERSGPASGKEMPWDGLQGRLWAEAEHNIALHWHEDGTIVVAPKKLLPLELDLETGEVIDGGWMVQKGMTTELPADTSLAEIAQLLISSYTRRDSNE